MVKISAFKAIRPIRDKASLVASRSYLTYSEETIREKLDHNPYTFLHIINPEYKLKNKKRGTEKFQKIRDKFKDFIKEGILIEDNKDSFYIYQQSNDLNTFTGIIGAVAIKDYLNGNIKKHEQTLKKREEMFCDYLNTTGFNAEPVLISYPKNKNINKIIQKYTTKRAEYEFTTTNKSLHKLWIISDEKDIYNTSNAFKDIDKLYIADGHHRTVSSALLSELNKSDKSNYFMSYLIDEKQLRILSFNRLIKSLNGFQTHDFIKKIKENFKVTEKKAPYSPTLKDEISMYIEKKWYSLIVKNKNVSSNLDPTILSLNILKPILNIIDERTDKNISFIDGKTPLSVIKQEVDNETYKVAFILKPITIHDIKDVADKGETLPPKSTYVEPKLRSGLTIYSMI